MKSESALVRRLREELELAHERIVQLEGALGMTCISPWQSLGLQPMEAKVLGMLMRRETLAREQMAIALYGDRVNDPPVDKIFAVYVSNIRRKLGVEIETVRSLGWRMPPESKAKVNRAVESQTNGASDAPESAEMLYDRIRREEREELDAALAKGR